MSIINFDYKVLGMFGTNCYLLKNEDSRKCVLIDPAEFPDQIQKMIDASGCELQAVLLTHGHSDHCMAAKEVCERNNVKLFASEAERALLADAQMNLSAQFGIGFSIQADVWLKDGDVRNIADMQFQVIHTPGHTAGGLCYYIKEAGLLFSGDSLFAESIGRTTFPSGSMSQLVRSINEKLFVLPDETKVLPGHGESTSIKHEKQYNPFF